MPCKEDHLSYNSILLVKRILAFLNIHDSLYNCKSVLTFWNFILDKPEAPQNLQSTEKTWESVKLKWDPGFNGGYPQTFIIVVQSVHGEKTVDVYPNGVYTFNVTRKLFKLLLSDFKILGVHFPNILFHKRKNNQLLKNLEI